MMQATVPSATDRIPLGTPVLTSNFWTGFETVRFNDQFTQLTGVQVKELALRASVFLPVNPWSRIKGWRKATLERVEETTLVRHDGYVRHTGKWNARFSYRAGGWQWVRFKLDSELTSVFVANDPSMLANILDELPLAKVFLPDEPAEQMKGVYFLPR